MNVLPLCLLLLACDGAKPKALPEPDPDDSVVPAGLTFRTVNRSFATFDVPIESAEGWRVMQDGWREIPPACGDESYYRSYPAACAPNPGPNDGKFEMTRVLVGKEPLTFSVQAYPTANPAETLLASEAGELTTIAGAKALVTHETYPDVGHYEETIKTFSNYLMVWWRVAGPISEQPTIRAIARQLRRTIELRP